MGHTSLVLKGNLKVLLGYLLFKYKRLAFDNFSSHFFPKVIDSIVLYERNVYRLKRINNLFYDANTFQSIYLLFST